MVGTLTSMSIGIEESTAWRQADSAFERSSAWALAHGARPTGTGPPDNASSRNRESAEVSRPEASVSKSPIWVIGVVELMIQFGRLWWTQRGGWSSRSISPTLEYGYRLAVTIFQSGGKRSVSWLGGGGFEAGVAFDRKRRRDDRLVLIAGRDLHISPVIRTGTEDK